MNIYILPYADVLAWCLMPNHFHLMVLVKHEIQPVAKTRIISQGFTQSEPLTKNTTEKTRTFNESIGIMLRSYTRAINKQKGFSDSLFRAETKAECINCKNVITPSFITENGIVLVRNQNFVKQCPQSCFNYIHQNPVKANLANSETDWEFSSALDYAKLRNGKLINKTVAKSYIDF